MSPHYRGSSFSALGKVTYSRAFRLRSMFRRASMMTSLMSLLLAVSTTLLRPLHKLTYRNTRATALRSRMRDLAENDALRGSSVAIDAPSVPRYGCGAALTGMGVALAVDTSGPGAMNVSTMLSARSDYDPYTDAALLNPWPGYKKLRDAGPA